MPTELPCWGCLVRVPDEWLRAYNGAPFCPDCWRRGTPQTLAYPPAISTENGAARGKKKVAGHGGPLATSNALWSSWALWRSSFCGTGVGRAMVTVPVHGPSVLRPQRLLSCHSRPGYAAPSWGTSAPSSGACAVEAQKEQLDAWAAGQGLRLARTYVDSRPDQPSLQRLLVDAATGRIGTVVCTTLDRLGRDGTTCARVCQQLDGLGVALVVTEAARDHHDHVRAG